MRLWRTASGYIKAIPAEFYFSSVARTNESDVTRRATFAEQPFFYFNANANYLPKGFAHNEFIRKSYSLTL